MTIWLVLIIIAATGCSGGGSGGEQNPAVRRKPPTAPLPEPDPLPEFTDYESAFPLVYFSHQVKTSDVPAIEDYLKYQNGIAENWLLSRDSGHIPTTYLATYDPDSIEYVDTTNGDVKGIEKLEKIRQDILNKCPVLADPRYSCPLSIWWQENDSDITGQYVPGGTHVKRVNGEFKFFAGIGEAIKPRSRLIIYGKNPLWNFPNQTSIELDKPWGIDISLTHELGHHLTQCIDENLGRSSYQTAQFSESFATTIEKICNPYAIDNPETTRVLYEADFGRIDFRKAEYRRKREILKGTQYAMRSLESYIVYEKYNNTFNANSVANTLVESYIQIKGRHLNPNLYPISFPRGGGGASAQWNFTLETDVLAIGYQPFVVTRTELLEILKENNSSGPVNELFQADIDGQIQSEW